MRQVRCNLCGADDYRVVFPAGYAQLHQIVRCRRCGLPSALGLAGTSEVTIDVDITWDIA